MPREAKPVSSRQRRNKPKVIEGSAVETPAPAASEGSGLVPAVSGAPRPPSGLSVALRRSWAGLWASPVAQLLDPVSDYPAVSRLYQLYQLGEQMDDRLSRPPVDEDGEGPSLESMMATRTRIASECRLMESQLGLSPRSRLALGLALLAGRKQGGGSLDDLADDANEEG